MKRLSILLLSMLMLLSAVAPVAASNDIRVIVDGIVVNFDVQPQIIDGRTMVPLRAIFEALGATVDWNESTKTITANKGDLFVKCAIGSYSMDTSSGSKTIDVPPTIINSRTLVPARFIAEGFNCDVQWDAANRRVTITSAPVEYVIVEHGDKKDEQKDNTVKQDNNNSEENEDTDKNDNTVKNTDDEDNSLAASDKLIAYLKRNGDREEAPTGDGYCYTIKKGDDTSLLGEIIEIYYDESWGLIRFTYTYDLFYPSVELSIYKDDNPDISIYYDNLGYYTGEYIAPSKTKRIYSSGMLFSESSFAPDAYSKFNSFLNELGLDIKLSDLNEFLVAD